MKNVMATSCEAITEREKSNAEVSRKIAEEGIVLLKNSGVLPFTNSVKSIALYGNGARKTVKGGTGSGDVNVRSFVTIEKGLLNKGFTIMTGDYLDEIDRLISSAEEEYAAVLKAVAKEKGAFPGLVYMMSNPLTVPEPPVLEKSQLKNADAAIYVISRNSGEGADRKLTPGDYLLTDGEISDIKLLSESYKNFVLLLNVGAVIELSPVVDYPDAIVLISQGGSSFGDATANVLTGEITPSGKLTTTWAEKYSDYPFGEEYASVSGELFDSYYKEDIFVGYRYFDSFNKKPLYPFGFGLSYTDFYIDFLDFKITDDVAFVSASVKNIGKFSGKEVLQLYVGKPSKKLSQPSKELIAFKKTKLLKPEEKETVTLSFDLKSMVSYDEKTASWILEKGRYVLYLGNSSKNITAVSYIEIQEEQVTERCKNLLRGKKISQLTHYNNENICESLPGIVFKKCKETKIHNYKFTTHIEEKAEKLTNEELALLCVGASRINLSDFTVIGNFSDALPGAAGETTSKLINNGINSITMVDGPAGIRINPVIHEKNGKYIKNPEEDPIFKFLITDDSMKPDLSGTETKYQYCTALPIATMMAQTWNEELLFEGGKTVGREMELLGVSLWLAPALNIQRNPLCGRNFEYYSEDPLLSGLCACAVVQGVQSVKGKGAVIKHFAANSQETNRNFNNSHLSERALREIYLKGFEICVKKANPWSVMTALNLINGIHAASDKELLTDILRHEWSFDGIVMTDWGTTGVPGSAKGQKYDCTYAVDCMKAGNDLIMPGSQRDVDYINNALEKGEIDDGLVRFRASNIIKTILKTEVRNENIFS